MFGLGVFVGCVITTVVLVAYAKWECGDCRGRRSEEWLRHHDAPNSVICATHDGGGKDGEGRVTSDGGTCGKPTGD